MLRNSIRAERQVVPRPNWKPENKIAASAFSPAPDLWLMFGHETSKCFSTLAFFFFCLRLKKEFRDLCFFLQFQSRNRAKLKVHLFSPGCGPNRNCYRSFGKVLPFPEKTHSVLGLLKVET